MQRRSRGSQPDSNSRSRTCRRAPILAASRAALRSLHREARGGGVIATCKPPVGALQPADAERGNLGLFPAAEPICHVDLACLRPPAGRRLRITSCRGGTAGSPGTSHAQPLPHLPHGSVCSREPLRDWGACGKACGMTRRSRRRGLSVATFEALAVRSRPGTVRVARPLPRRYQPSAFRSHGRASPRNESSAGPKREIQKLGPSVPAASLREADVDLGRRAPVPPTSPGERD